MLSCSLIDKNADTFEIVLAVEDVVNVCSKYPTEELSLFINLMSFEGLDANKTGLYPSLVFSPVLYQQSPSSSVYQIPLLVQATKTF